MRCKVIKSEHYSICNSKWTWCRVVDSWNSLGWLSLSLHLTAGFSVQAKILNSTAEFSQWPNLFFFSQEKHHQVAMTSAYVDIWYDFIFSAFLFYTVAEIDWWSTCGVQLNDFQRTILSWLDHFEIGGGGRGCLWKETGEFFLYPFSGSYWRRGIGVWHLMSSKCCKWAQNRKIEMLKNALWARVLWTAPLSSLRKMYSRGL